MRKQTATRAVCTFYVTTTTGETTEWYGLTLKQARDMYAYTEAHQPSNVDSYGWEEVKPVWGTKSEVPEELA